MREASAAPGSRGTLDRRPRHASPSAVWLALLGVCGACENDVAVRLLPPSPVESAGGATTPDCADGDPCSGHAWALSFEGAYDRVEVASSNLLDLPQDFAIEAWVYVRSYNGGHGILNRWIADAGDIELTMGTPEPVPNLKQPSLALVPSHYLASWAFVRENTWLTAVAPTQPSPLNWHHVATSYGGGAFRLYVDGKLASRKSSTESVANPESTLFLGATARHQRPFDAGAGTLYWPAIDGFIAEVRLSSSDRYPADFVPEARLSADPDTIALWHLDEGKGNVAIDSGPNKLKGDIVGASWVQAPIRVVGSSM